jgi:hypothetical protein
MIGVQPNNDLVGFVEPRGALIDHLDGLSVSVDVRYTLVMRGFSPRRRDESHAPRKS